MMDDFFMMMKMKVEKLLWAKLQGNKTCFVKIKKGVGLHIPVNNIKIKTCHSKISQQYKIPL